ncbi:oxidoreductase C-terminal domain-containing protein [Nocardia wallacei]|uniref:oxidoreductase C-terminal domain-containing protein n=1 Tax=Nocardia wallacei TaxID=480035 RepID=UPI003CC7C9B9
MNTDSSFQFVGQASHHDDLIIRDSPDDGDLTALPVHRERIVCICTMGHAADIRTGRAMIASILAFDREILAEDSVALADITQQSTLIRTTVPRKSPDHRVDLVSLGPRADLLRGRNVADTKWKSCYEYPMTMIAIETLLSVDDLLTDS